MEQSDLSDENGFDGYARANHQDLEDLGSTLRTEAQTQAELALQYLTVLGPIAEQVLGVDMVTDAATLDSAVSHAVDQFVALCTGTGGCN